MVFTSSAATIQQLPHRLATEADAEPWPLTDHRPLYATVKIAIEQEVLRAAAEGLPVVVVNPSICLGEYDAHAFSGRLLLAFAKYRLPCYLEHDLNVVYTGDVGVGHVRAAGRSRPGERYLLCGENLTLKTFAERVAAVAGVPPPRWRLPPWVAHATALVSEAAAAMTGSEPWLSRQVIGPGRRGLRLDGTKARQELAMPQTPVEEAIRRALAWFRAAGTLD